MLARAAARAVTFEATVINLRARLREREVRRAKARARLRSDQAMNHLGERPLQVRHSDAAINAQTFNLIEHWIVRCIRRVASEHSTGRNHSERRSAPLHSVNLHGRSL